jgi:site-specific recombinase XerD
VVRPLVAIPWGMAPRAPLRAADAPQHGAALSHDDLGERDLDPRRGSLLVRGTDGRRREIGMDAWGWEQLSRWLAARVALPIGPLFCVIDGPTRGRPWSSAKVRVEIPPARRSSRRQAPLRAASLRHAHAVEFAREGLPPNVIQRQLGHANLRTTRSTSGASTPK